MRQLRWVVSGLGAIFLQGLLTAGLTSFAVAANDTNTPVAKPGVTVEGPAQEQVLRFYIAKGEANACGEGCGDWIAVEGRIEKGAGERFQAFLRQHRNLKLPVYFNSPGGSEGDALTIGRLLRERGLTAGVARTVPLVCADAASEKCQEAKRSSQPVVARWNSLNSYCNSSCVYALIGAKVRDVPAGARLGVHSSKLVSMTVNGRAVDLTSDHLPSPIKARIASLKLVPRKYVRDMGIGEGLNEAIAATPYETVHILSRTEIMQFGIDRRARQETGWMLTQEKSADPSLAKIVVETTAGDESATTISLFRIFCRPSGELIADFFRSMPLGERAASTAHFVIGGRATEFAVNSGFAKGDSIEPRAEMRRHVTSPPRRFFDEVALRDNFEIVETVKSAEKVTERKVMLSASGLAPAMADLRRACGVGNLRESDEPSGRNL